MTRFQRTTEPVVIYVPDFILDIVAVTVYILWVVLFLMKINVSRPLTCSDLLQALSHFFLQVATQVSVHFFRSLSLSCVCRFRASLRPVKYSYTEVEESSSQLSPFQDPPLTIQGWLLRAMFSGSCSLKDDGGLSIAILAVHTLCACGPLSGKRHTHTKGHWPMC